MIVVSISVIAGSYRDSTTQESRLLGKEMIAIGIGFFFVVGSSSKISQDFIVCSSYGILT